MYCGEGNTDIGLEPFQHIHPALIDEAMRVLEVLELFPTWTITQILDQPRALLDAVVSLKSTGTKMQRQLEDEKKGKY